MYIQSNRPVDWADGPSSLPASAYWVEAIVKRNENKIFRIALTMMGNKAEAEDIVQDVFVKLVEKSPTFNSQDHETAWLIRVAVNLCKSRFRSHWWKKTVPLLDSYPAQTSHHHDLVEAVLNLPQKYRIVTHLFYYEGYSTKEIAELTEQKESTVRAQLTRARQMLRDVLKGE